LVAQIEGGTQAESVLGKILGPKKDEVTEEWRKLLKEELYDLYCSPNIVLVIKSRMR